VTEEDGVQGDRSVVGAGLGCRREGGAVPGRTINRPCYPFRILPSCFHSLVSSVHIPNNNNNYNNSYTNSSNNMIYNNKFNSNSSSVIYSTRYNSNNYSCTISFKNINNNSYNNNNSNMILRARAWVRA